MRSWCETFTSATSFNTDWLFTFRPRVGVTFGNALLYATGGLAVTNEKVTQTSGVLNVATFNSSLSETRLGWVVGGGLEYAVDRNSGQFKAPFNQIRNEPNVFTYKDTAIVTPNSDTPYSFVWMDLRTLRLRYLRRG